MPGSVRRLPSALKPEFNNGGNMRIAIIGAGNVGSGLATVLARAGIKVTLGARDVGKAKAVAKAIGANVSAATLKEAAASAQTVFLAVPYPEAGSALSAAGDLGGKVIVDVTNPLTPDYMGLTLGHSTSAAEEIQKLVPGAKVVKAFNTVFAQIYAAGARINGTAVPVFIAGDDEAATRDVELIARQAGFSPVQVGALRFARYLEPLAGLNIALGYGRGMGTAIAPMWLK
ncbi:MAG: NADPH-dependent F420 reductase [Acidiferrobacterales bacterium]